MADVAEADLAAAEAKLAALNEQIATLESGAPPAARCPPGLPACLPHAVCLEPVSVALALALALALTMPTLAFAHHRAGTVGATATDGDVLASLRELRTTLAKETEEANATAASRDKVNLPHPPVAPSTATSRSHQTDLPRRCAARRGGRGARDGQRQAGVPDRAPEEGARRGAGLLS